MLRIFYVSVVVEIFCMCSFVYGSGVTLVADFEDTDYPEGGTPASPTDSKTFTFDLDVPAIRPNQNQYWTIDVKLVDVTEWTGSCANYVPKDASGNPIADAVGKDLKLKASDNGGWTWISDTHLQFEITTDPADQHKTPPETIVVRCYDFGAYGKLQVTVKKNDLAYGNDDGTIPIDLNENMIADGWEKKHMFTINGDSDLANISDTETGPVDTNEYPGDGWSAFDEYRGLIVSKAAGHKRLNPRVKEFMVCYHPGEKAQPGQPGHPDMAEWSLGAMPALKNHVDVTVHPDFVNDPWGASFDAAGNVTTGQDTGWVNQYSGNPAVPNFQRVWAIRIRSVRRPEGSTFHGIAVTGSPSYLSIAEIYMNEIDDWVEAGYKKYKEKYEENTERYEDQGKEWDKGTPKNINAAKALVKRVTIAHEVLHTLNLAHCDHEGCHVNPENVLIFPEKDGVAYYKTPPAADGTMPPISLDSAHLLKVAVTGAIGGGEGDNGHTLLAEGEYMSGSPMYSLVSSDGIYTAEAGTGHEANFTTTQAYSNVSLIIIFKWV